MSGVERHGSGYTASEGGLLKLAEPGVVYTKSWVVGLVLDVAGYDPNANLVDSTAVEPSCGNGEFLEEMVRRLSASCRRQRRPLRECESSLVAFDLSAEAVEKSRERVSSVLADCGWSGEDSRIMARKWVRRADFLLDPDLNMASLGGGVDFVVGNPPYVRLGFLVGEVPSDWKRAFARKEVIGYIGFHETRNFTLQWRAA